MTIVEVVKEALKQSVRQNEILYRNYIRLANPSKRYPNKDTSLTIEGFPRSANTYCLYLASQVIERPRISSHIHNIACLKASSKRGIPIVILIREPKAAIISWMQKNQIASDSSRAARIFLKGWLQFYQYAHYSLPECSIVDFADVTTNPSGFITLIASLTENQAIGLDSHALADQALLKLEQMETTKPWNASSLPRKHRESEKNDYEMLFEHIPELQCACQMYECMRERSIKLQVELP